MELSPQQEKDIELMWVFIRAGYQNLELSVLNWYRLYLQVSYLSDICNALGGSNPYQPNPQTSSAGISGPEYQKPP